MFCNLLPSLLPNISWVRDYYVLQPLYLPSTLIDPGGEVFSATSLPALLPNISWGRNYNVLQPLYLPSSLIDPGGGTAMFFIV